MWATEHSREMAAATDAIWRSWAEVEHWTEWQPNFERAELRGPFEPGSTIAVRPRGKDPLQFRIVDMAEAVSWADEADVDGTTIRISHRIERLDEGRVRVVYRIETEGPRAEELGSEIGSGFPDSLQVLVEHLGV